MSYKNYTDFHSTSSFVCRKLAQRDRRLRLIAHLRGVCYLGSLEAFDSNTLRQRCALVRLVALAHEVLRWLVNIPRLNQAKPKPINEKGR